MCRGKISYSADWFSLGVIIYELVTGELPYAKSWSGNKKYELKFPQRAAQLSAPCKSILEQLLKEHPAERLGHVNDGNAVLAHPWFDDNNLDFDALFEGNHASILVTENSEAIRHERAAGNDGLTDYESVVQGEH